MQEYQAEPTHTHRMQLASVVTACLVAVTMQARSERDYPVYRMPAPPVLDGSAATNSWQHLPEAEGFLIYRAAGFAWRKPTSFHMGWDDEALYVYVHCKEPFPHRMAPSVAKDGAHVFREDSVELFLAPDGTNTWQFVVGSAGGRWNAKNYMQERKAPDSIWDWQAQVRVEGDAWETELRIPFAVLGVKPGAGDRWRFNLARNLESGPEAEKRTCWAPVTVGFGEVTAFPGLVFHAGQPEPAERSAAEAEINAPFRAFNEERRAMAENRVCNGAFEAGMEHWHPRPYRVRLDDTTSTRGRRSILLDGELAPAEAPVFVSAYQHVELEPDTRYVLRADIKRSKFYSGIVSVDVLERESAEDGWTSHRAGDRPVEGDLPGAWGRYATSFKTGETVGEARVMLYNIRSGAKAWYDNIQLHRDDGSGVLAGRRRRTLIFDVQTRDAAATLLVNGEAMTAEPGQPVTVEIEEGVNCIAVEAVPAGADPGVRVRLRDHPYTDGRWRVSATTNPPSAWPEVNYDDRAWPVANPDTSGYMWSTSAAARVSMRQLLLWNAGHDGPDRCINPLIREWGISEGSAETLWTAVYSPFPFTVEDYEFILDVPADFRLLDCMHEIKVPEVKRHPTNVRPSGLAEETVTHDDRPYRRYRLAFAPEDIYAVEESIITRYSLIPVFLKTWTGQEDATAWYYRRQAKGNFVELQQRVPVRILPPIDGRRPETVMISHFVFAAGTWSARISREHLLQYLAQALDAGFNTWMLRNWNIERNPYLKLAHDRLRDTPRTRIALTSHYPYYGAREHRHWGHLDTDRFLLRWLEETPQACARYWQDTETWETKGQYCPTYALGEGRDEFYRRVLGLYRLKLEGLPGASIVWSDFEQAPWGAGSIGAHPEDGSGSWCFCERCKAAFREWAGLPADADLSDENIFAAYHDEWHRFRSHLDGKLAAIPKQAANKLGRKYMMYSWMSHEYFWKALKGNIDLAFVGSPGNHAADAYLQPKMDRDAAFMRDEAGMPGGTVMGQRFSFFKRYARLPTQDHEEYWRAWTVLSPTGYVEPKSWKNQVVRVTAAFGGGVDLQNALCCSGGMLYWIGEATRLIAAHEGFFVDGKREDDLADCDDLTTPNVLVLTKDGERLVLLFNESHCPLDVVLHNRGLGPGWSARVFETEVGTHRPVDNAPYNSRAGRGGGAYQARQNVIADHEQETNNVNPRVKLGLYGCGNRTRALLDSLFLDEEYEVVAAYDVRKPAAQSACDKYGGVVCATSQELVTRPEIDAFLISLDPFAHPAAFHETVEAGKPIFIEKPIAMTAAEARDMMQAAERRQVPVQVGFMRRYYPQHVAARQFMQENDPGTLFGVHGRWFHPGETEMINMLTNWPDNFRLKVSQIPFHCCHALDVMLLYGGNVKAVSSIGRKVINRPYPSPDELISTLEFENGAIGSFHYCSMAYQGGITYRVHTENYTLTFEAGSSFTISQRPPLRSLRETGEGDCRPLYHANIAPETRQYAATKVDHLVLSEFLHSVRTGAPMSAPINAGYRVAELAEAIERSWREEKRIQLDLKAV